MLEHPAHKGIQRVGMEQPRKQTFDHNPSPGTETSRDILRSVGIGLLYLLLARASLFFVSQPEGVAAIWPPSGLALAALLLTKRRPRPGVLTAIFLANLCANLLGGSALSLSLVFALANSFETILIAWLLLSFMEVPLKFERLGQALLFFAIVTFGNASSALLGAALVSIYGGADFWHIWATWWVADGLGIVLITPLILAWQRGSSGDDAGVKPGFGKSVEGLVLVGIVSLVSAYIFLTGATVPLVEVRGAYLLFPSLIWAGLRFGQRFVTGLLFYVSLIAIIGTLYERGRFYGLVSDPGLHLMAVQLYLGVLIAITLLLAATVKELRQTGQKLAISEAGYHNIFQSASFGIFQTRLDGSFVQANPAMAEILGYASPEELLASVHNISSQIYLDASRYAQLLDKALQTTDWVSDESLGRRQDGRVILGKIMVRQVLSQDGRPAYLEGFLEDISEQQRMEDALLESAQEFRSIVEASPSAMQLYRLKIDGGLMLIGANPAADRLLGIDHLDLVSQPIQACLPAPLVNEEFLEMCRQVARGHLENQSLEVQFAQARLEGSFELRIFRTAPGFFVLDYEDVTDHRLNARLAQARSRLLEFSSTHSLDELLTATLDEAEALTGSQVGFYHFLEADQTTLFLQNWSTRTLQKYCQASGKGTHYPVSQAGVWADCVRTRQPIIHNDYASLPNRKGLPEGHAALIRELVIPVKRENKIVAILGVGNKPWDYAQRDLEIVAELADLAWDVTGRKRAESALQESVALLNETQALAQVGGWDYDLASQKMTWTKEVYRIYGVADDYDPSNVSEDVKAYAPEDQQIIDQAFQKAISAGQPYDLVLRFINALGQQLWVRTRGNPVYENGQVVKVTGTIMDISGLKKAQLALERSEEQLRLAMDASDDGVWDWNCQDSLLAYSPAYYRMLGYQPDEIPITPAGWLGLVHSADRERAARVIKDCMENRIREFEIEMRLRTGNGSYKWVLSRGMVASRDEAGKALRVVGTHVDINVRKMAEEAQRHANRKLERQIAINKTLQEMLVEQATHDVLTGLYNRRFMDDVLQREILRADREGSLVSVLLLDIDHFKRFNDRYGHDVGDDVLVALGELLREMFRESDIACRYGGEEFVVILPEANAEDACLRAELLRDNFSRLAVGKRMLSATLSGGVAMYPSHGASADELIRAADIALYMAKEAGRNCIRVFDR